MNLIGFRTLLILIPGALLLVGCQQPGQISSGDSASLKASANGATSAEEDDVPPVSDKEDDDYNAKASRGDCGNFLNAAGAANINAVDDLSLVNNSGNLDYLQPIRNLTIESVSGNILIKSAINVSVNRLNGNIKLNAVNILKLERVSGNICMRALAVKEMDNGSGNTHVVAQTIDSILVQSGNFHIYGATVKIANGINGNLCLHDGAKVLDLSNFSGNVKTNCN